MRSISKNKHNEAIAIFELRSLTGRKLNASIESGIIASKHGPVCIINPGVKHPYKNKKKPPTK